MKKIIVTSVMFAALLTPSVYSFGHTKNNVPAKNHSNAITDPLLFTRKLRTVKAAPLTFNSPGKYLEYKRKLVMEGEDSARAYVKGYERGMVDGYLPLSGGELTGNLVITNANLGVYGSSIVANVSTDTYLQTLAENGYVSIQGKAFTSGTRPISLNPNGGNVGIGTASPQGNLDIFNTVANSTLLSIRSNFNVNGNYGMIRFGDYTQTTDYQKGALIYESVSGSARGKFHIALENTDGAGSVALSDAKLTVLSNGNVGIGTREPGSKLSVYESGSSTNLWKGRVDFGGDNARIVAGEYNNTGFLGAHNTALNAWANLAINAEGGNVGIGTKDPQSKMHINEAEESRTGGVNAGTKSVLKLSRAGTGGYAFNEGAEFRIGHGSDVLAGSKLDLFINSSTHYDNNTAPDKHAMTWMHNGNVGIGTTSPNAQLDITGQQASQLISSSSASIASNFVYSQLRFRSWNGASNGVFTNDDASIQIQRNGQYYSGDTWTHASDMVFLTNRSNRDNTPTEAMRIDYNGNVGIGGIQPNEKLHIAGNAKIESGQIRFYTPYNDGGGSTGIMGNPNGWTRIDPNGGRFIVTTNIASVNASQNIFDIESVDDNWKHMMELKADGSAYFAGNIAIGTTTQPGFMLAVNGDTKVRKLKVTITDWSDYVFAPTYKLPTLTEIEAYINKYKHLPDVPSAEEVQKEGLDVGGNQAVLLKKIEELTLYTIEQDKKWKETNRQLEEDNKKAKKVNEELMNRLEKLEKLINKTSN